MQRKNTLCQQKADQSCYIKVANRMHWKLQPDKTVWNEDSHLHVYHCENLKDYLLWNYTNRQELDS